MSGNDATASDAVNVEPDDGGCSHVGTESVDADVPIVRRRKRERSEGRINLVINLGVSRVQLIANLHMDQNHQIRPLCDCF